MRSVTFARIAAQAELLRLRHLVRRQAMRVVFAVVAATFLLAALIGLHVACALLLAEYLSPVQASLIVAGVDLVVAIVLAGSCRARRRRGRSSARRWWWCGGRP